MKLFFCNLTIIFVTSLHVCFGCFNLTSDNMVKIKNDKYYYINYHIKANFFRANEFCQSLGLEFATIEHWSQLDLLVENIKALNLAKDDRRFWLGGHDMGHESYFVWLTTGRPLNISEAWLTDEPNNSGNIEHCVELWDRNDYYKLNDLDCLLDRFFICQYTPKKCSDVLEPSCSSLIASA